MTQIEWRTEQGLAATLFARLEAQARVAGAALFTADVSLCAAH
jgi:hypothetical protein